MFFTYVSGKDTVTVSRFSFSGYNPTANFALKKSNAIIMERTKKIVMV